MLTFYRFLKYIPLLLVLTSFNASLQTRQIQTSVANITYSETLEQPLVVEYRVYCWDGTFSRRGLEFKKPPGIKTSDNKDYYKNEWDKGHMAPAAAFSCDEDSLKATFSYLNCALQHEGLNRGPWKSLEKYERELAEKYGYVDVIINIEFYRVVRVPAGAAIPTSFVKTIITPNDQHVFAFPNSNVKGRNFLEFKI